MRTIGVDVPQSLAQRPIASVDFRAAQLGPDSLGVGIRDWHGDYAEVVARSNAAAIVLERPRADARPPVILVDDANLALSSLAAEIAGHPARALKVVGITGTDGKTTIATLVESGLAALGARVGRSGTTGAVVVGEPYPLYRTTPDAPDLHGLLAHMRERGCEVAVLEVGAMGLRARRVDAIGFHVGVFTNLSPDHLDVLETMDAYAAAKARLCGELLRPEGGWPRALLCRDDPAWTRMRAPADRWTYGFDPNADLRVEAPRYTIEGAAAQLRTPVGVGALRTRLTGRYNLQNAAAAVGVLLTLDVPLDAACEAIAAAAGPPGRMERVANDRGLQLIVDYAHTPQGLATVLGTLRPLTEGRLWVVFGCGGDKDPGRRTGMGEVAARLADEVVLTSDNPRSESPAAIAATIAAAMGRAPTHVELDRAAAVAWAITHASPGDTLVFAGKGHETTQIAAGRVTPYSEREAVIAALERGS